jgi:hypothetical protein
MGMDLVPIKISDGYPGVRPVTPEERRLGCPPEVKRLASPLMFNWTGWRWLIDRLDDWGVDTCEFVYHNDGDFISAATCSQVADAIETHLGEVNDEDRRWLEKQIPFWRYSGGFEQW